MSRIKDENFDEITFRMELTRLYKELENLEMDEEFSPIIVAKSFFGMFNLTDEDILLGVKMYYNF